MAETLKVFKKAETLKVFKNTTEVPSNITATTATTQKVVKHISVDNRDGYKAYNIKQGNRVIAEVPTGAKVEVSGNIILDNSNSLDVIALIKQDYMIGGDEALILTSNAGASDSINLNNYNTSSISWKADLDFSVTITDALIMDVGGTDYCFCATSKVEKYTLPISTASKISDTGATTIAYNICTDGEFIYSWQATNLYKINPADMTYTQLSSTVPIAASALTIGKLNYYDGCIYACHADNNASGRVIYKYDLTGTLLATIPFIPTSTTDNQVGCFLKNQFTNEMYLIMAYDNGFDAINIKDGSKIASNTNVMALTSNYSNTFLPFKDEVAFLYSTGKYVVRFTDATTLSASDLIVISGINAVYNVYPSVAYKQIPATTPIPIYADGVEIV